MARFCWLASTLLLASILVSCGGDGSDDASSPAPPPPTPQLPARVTFGAALTRTVLPTGTLPFAVSPALAANEAMVCLLDGLTTPCIDSSGTGGRIAYADLAPRVHAFAVEIRAGDNVLSRTESFLDVTRAEVVVYGGTPGGIVAAIAAARAGRTVAVLEPTRWLGGMMSGGLTKTDIGNRGVEVISGLTLDVFRRIRMLEAARGVCTAPCDGLWDFEPQVAERAFEALAAEHQIIVERDAALVEARKEGTTVRSVVTSRGEATGQVFVDASYEGDLIAAAGVPFTIGREAKVIAAAGDAEQLALQEDHAGTQRFTRPRGVYVDPYVVPGDPGSGTLPYVEPRVSPVPAEGSGDSRVMAYTYRLCVTDDPTNRVPFSAPEGYDPARYEANGRLFDELVKQRGADLGVVLFNPARTVPSLDRNYYKHDLNGGSTFSIDMTAPDMNQAYVLADAAGRERIRRAYQDYTRGMLYFWQTDPRLRNLNEKIARFGYCKDEFTDRNGWPHQLYVRVGRRMIGEYVMNENDMMQNGRRPPVSDPIGFGAYNVDVHYVRYAVVAVNRPDGTQRDELVNEGSLTVLQPNDEPYPISYRIMVPRADAATNLLSPVAVSATHVAHSAVRMEPTFMMLGQAAGAAAALAIESQLNVQAVSYPTLRARLAAFGQRLP